MKSRLNVVLAERRLTKREVCRRTGFTPETLWRWSTDSGIEGATVRSLMRVAEAIGCEVRDLFEG